MNKQFLLLVLSVFLLYSCENKKDLSREKATKMIAEFHNFPQVKTVNFGLSAAYGDKFLPVLQKLETQGLIKIVKEANSLHQNCVVCGVANYISLTSKGEKFQTDLGRNELVGYVVDLKEVTGIKFNGDKTEAEVDYTTVISKVSPFGEAFIDNKNISHRTNVYSMEDRSKDKYGLIVGAEKTKKVKMSLFDDGWRVSSTESKDGNVVNYEQYKELFGDIEPSKASSSVGNDEVISQIKERYATIFNGKYRKEEVDKSDSQMGMAGTCISTYYTDEAGNIARIDLVNGNTIEEQYYFWDNKLFFVFIKWELMEDIQENRYYINNDELIICKKKVGSKGENKEVNCGEVENDDKFPKNVIDKAERLRSFYKSKNYNNLCN